MRAPLSSVNGPEAASCPFSLRLARYCRCVGRSSAIFALSRMYSMMAANFMAGSLRRGSRDQGRVDLRRRGPLAQGVQREQDSREPEVADERVDGKRQGEPVGRHQAAQVA